MVGKAAARSISWRAKGAPKIFVLVGHSTARPGFLYNESCWRALPEMCKVLLAIGSHAALSSRIAAGRWVRALSRFGATIFATTEFCSAAESTLPPYLGVQIARHYLSGGAPVMSVRLLPAPMRTRD